MADLATTGLSPEAVRAIDLATVIARNSGHRTVTPDHLATALLKQSDGLASKLLRTHLGINLFELRSRLEAGVRDLQDSLTPGELTHRYQGEPYSISPELGRVVARAKDLAVQQRKPVAGTDHILAALLDEDTPATHTFRRAGIAADRIESASADIPLPPALARRHGAAGAPDGTNGTSGAASGAAVQDLVAVIKAGMLPRVAERSTLLRQLANLLVQPQTSVVLLGETGVGRRSLVQALAQVLARAPLPPLPGLPAALYAISPAALLDGPELVIRQAVQQAQGAILALPDLHQFFGASPLTGFAEAGVTLRQALLEDRLRLVGTSTPPLHTRYLEPDPVLRDHLRTLLVPPATEAETLAALAAAKPVLERDSGVTVAEASLKTAYTLSRQYLPGPQPAAAIGLLQRACALVRLSQTAVFAPVASPHPSPATREGESFPSSSDSSQASLSPSGRGAEGEAAAATTVDPSDVAQALHQQTGIPIGQIAGQEQDRLARMEEILHQRIVGQDAAISALARAVRRARAGLKDPKRPIGSFLFLGPSGVGKTESALALAEFLFGAEDAVITLNMSEYMEKHNVARLIGAPPGYVGYEEGGQLTERVRQRPYAVVLVDEVEKAHPDVYDLFLQVLDQGQLQDSRGRVVSFRNTVVIMTSNLGTRALTYPEDLAPGEDPKQAVLDAVRAHFRPEFLNRLDGIIVFDPLDRPALGKILDLMLAKLARQLGEQGIALDVTPAARDWLLEQHQEPENGARPLIRILQTHVKDAIAARLIDGALTPGQTITADVATGAADVATGAITFRQA
ncbi:MAG: AAA family ATPase [Chloroflexota bacterium]